MLVSKPVSADMFGRHHGSLCMLRVSVSPENVRLEMGAGTHDIETSSEWSVQRATPQPRCEHEPMSDSVPVHCTKSSQTGPTPGPYRSDRNQPARLHSSNKNSKKLISRGERASAIFRVFRPKQRSRQLSSRKSTADTECRMQLWRIGVRCLWTTDCRWRCAHGYGQAANHSG